MIVPMKKVALVVMDRERERALERLREVGVVHLERRSVASDRLQSLLEKKARIETAAGLLRNFDVEAASGPAPDADAFVAEVLAAQEAKKAAQEALAAALKERSRVEPWGDFDPTSLAALAASGVELVPCELPAKAFEALGDEARVVVLSRGKSLVRVLAVGKPFGPAPSLSGAVPFALPAASLSALSAEADALRDRAAAADARLRALAANRTVLEAEAARVLAQIEFETARAGMDATADSPEGLGVAWLYGYVPAEEARAVKAAASEHGWALIVDDPAPGDAPPTKVKNSALVRIVQPVFDLLGTVPGYREYDISLSFLAFFTLFFAMIFGDGGYGALMLAGALFFSLKAKAKTGRMPDAGLLFIVLTSATVAWGAITGTWFALPFESLHPVLKALVIPPFFPDPSLDPKEAARLVQQNVKQLCFVIGTVQLVYAHAKNIKKTLPSLTAIAQLGWLSMVLGLYFLVLNLVLDKNAFPVPSWALWMIGGGISTYFVFAEQKGGNFFKNVLASFGNFLPTFLSAVSSFSDIISYIRLFAVGLAGFAIAESFNGMAGGMPAGVVRIVAGGLILFFGHGLNLCMSALSVVVHGVRLNMLEYSGHLGMEWSGVKYAPFALKDEARR